MAKRRKTATTRKSGAGVNLAKFESEVATHFREAGFVVQHHQNLANTFLAYREPTRALVVVHPTVTLRKISEAVEMRRRLSSPEYVGYVWIIGMELNDDVYVARAKYADHLRVLNRVEFKNENLHLNWIPEPSLRRIRQPKMRTRVGKALMVNVKDLRVAVGTSILLIEDKLNTLKEYRPNLPQAIAERDEEIQVLTRMRVELESILDLPEGIKKGIVKESDASRSVKTFADGVRDYWNKQRISICDKAYNAGLFASMVLVCSLAGASSNWTLAVSAAMVGGKPVMDGLKGLSRKLF
jgi:hypothetical protein